jgi:hypothetical protein
MAEDAERAAATMPAAQALDAAAMERVWQRIEGRLELAAQTAPTAPAHRPHAASWLAAAAALACAVALALVLHERSPVEDGIKGDRRPVVVTDASLRFATVKNGRELEPGVTGKPVKLGTPIVFSVETPAGAAQRPRIDLDAVTPAGDVVAVARGYQLRQPKDVLSDDAGYLAFIPSAPGWYSFRLRIKDETRDIDAASISIEVVGP